MKGTVRTRNRRSTAELSTKDYSWAWYVLTFLMWVLYFVVTITEKIDLTENPLGVSESTVMILRLTISLPYLFVWLAAVHGAVRLREYSNAIEEETQKRAFTLMTVGLYWMTVNMIGTTIVSSMKRFIGEGAEVDRAMTLLVNYTYIILPLISFWYLFVGARRLTGGARKKEISTAQLIIYIVLSAASVMFLFLILTDPHQASIETNPDLTDYLSTPVVILTILLPAVISWFLGSSAAFHLIYYVHASRAALYEKTLPYLSHGIVALVISSSILQFLVGSSRVDLQACKLEYSIVSPK